MDAIASAIRVGIDPHLDLDEYDPDADLMVLNFGPQHPSTHGVLRLKLYLDGETVVKAITYMGYLHRGKEKLAEKLTYAQVTPIVDKIDYVAPMTTEQGINMAYEALLDIEVPRRARYLRTILAELQRIASHLLWVATMSIDLGGALGGGTTVFMHCFRERESILDLFEDLTGCRFHYNTHCVGGNRHDITADWPAKVKATLDVIDSRIEEYESLTVGHRIFRERMMGIGVLPGDLALELGITGPNLRASGVDHDLRRDAPFHVYDELDVKVQTEKAGDCQARTLVRIREMREAIRIVRELIDNVPEGPINGTKPVKSPTQFKAKGGQAYACLEGPRGEVGAYVIGGGDNRGASPYRVKFRSPSMLALGALPYILPGHSVSDVVAVLGSLDPILGEVDR